MLFAQILAIKADKRRSFRWHGRNRTVVLEGNRQETKETDKAKPPSTKRSSHKEVRKESLQEAVFLDDRYFSNLMKKNDGDSKCSQLTDRPGTHA